MGAYSLTFLDVDGNLNSSNGQKLSIFVQGELALLLIEVCSIHRLEDLISCIKYSLIEVYIFP